MAPQHGTPAPCLPRAGAAIPPGRCWPSQTHQRCIPVAAVRIATMAIASHRPIGVSDATFCFFAHEHARFNGVVWFATDCLPVPPPLPVAFSRNRNVLSVASIRSRQPSHGRRRDRGPSEGELHLCLFFVTRPRPRPFRCILMHSLRTRRTHCLPPRHCLDPARLRGNPLPKTRHRPTRLAPPHNVGKAVAAEVERRKATDALGLWRKGRKP